MGGRRQPRLLLDTEIDSDEEEFDYKSELKSETGVTKLAKRIVNAYRKELRKGRAKELTAYLAG